MDRFSDQEIFTGVPIQCHSFLNSILMAALSETNLTKYFKCLFALKESKMPIALN